MINKYRDGVVPSEEEGGERVVVGEEDWPQVAAAAVAAAVEAMDRFDLSGSIGAGLGLVRRVDGFINRTEPFKRAKDPAEARNLEAILYQCLEAVRIASLLLAPVLPERMAELWRAIGLEIDPRSGRLAELAEWGGLQPGTKVEKVALFPRIEAPAAS